MIPLRTWLRAWLRPDRAPARRPSPRPAVELLEDRRLLSTTAADYTAWRAQRYTLSDQLTAATAPPVAQTLAASTQPVNNSFGADIGLDKAFATYPYRGTGYTVAVLDTGIDYTHADLGGGWGKRVVGGYDFVNKDADPMDDNGHGTHVAGIIGASSATYSGVAPDVHFVALKVLDSTGSGSFGDIEDALRWVIDHQAQYNIVAVNLSLGASNYTTNPYTFLDDEFTSLKTEGVFVAVAAGNDFYSVNSQPGLAYPAISPQVVSVGAVWDGSFGQVAWASGARDYTTAPDRVASFSQRSGALSIMAPGAIIHSTYLGGGYQDMAGTSMATPVVAGAAVLLHQALDAKHLAANRDTILSLMRSTGVTVNDGDDEDDNVTNTGLNFKRLDLNAALNAVGPVGNVAPALDPVPDQTLRAGRSLTVPLSAFDANGDPLTFAAVVLGTSSSTLAAQLRQQYGLVYAGSYYTNSYGANEKWIKGSGDVWFCLMPTGDLRRWAGSMAETLKPANLIATLGVAYYTDPTLLLNAQAGTAGPLTARMVGSQLVLSAPVGTTGTFQVQVTASDGKLAASRTLTVRVVANSAPVIAAIANQTVLSGRTLGLAIPATDADADTLQYTARIVDNPALATLTLVGNKLSLKPNIGKLGQLTVEVTASDGLATATRRFTVDIRGDWTTQAAGDLNADGKEDLFSFNSGDGTWWVNVSTGAGFTLQLLYGMGIYGHWTQNVVGDFNGDGRTDVASFNANSGTWYVGLSTGTGVTVASWAANWSRSDAWLSVQVGDFTGDGKADIAAFHASGQWWIATSSGAAFATTLWAGNWSGGRVWQFFVGDFNGDGKKDIAAFYTGGEWWVAQSNGSRFTTVRWDDHWSAGSVWEFHVGDFNNDGKDDVAAFHTSGEWWVAESTGRAFATSRWAYNWSKAGVWTFVPGDFNGDGKADLGAFYTGGEWWLAQSTGGGFATARWGTAWAPRDTWVAFLAGDFDGDGKTDIASLSTDGQWWLAKSTGASFQAALWSAAKM
jgi:subtilisin family serine protease